MTLERKRSRQWIFRLGLVSAMCLSACVSESVRPSNALIDARTAIVRAEQADARRYASAELDEAQERLAQAQRATGMQEMLRAERFANEALVSARLAMARTEAAKAEEINRDMTRLSDALIQEIERTGDPK